MDFWQEWLFWALFSVVSVGAVIATLTDTPKGKKNVMMESCRTIIVIASVVSVVCAFIFITWQGGLVTIVSAIAGYVIGEMNSGRTDEDYEY
jgi:mannitol-specific phosphotransferase system IIBC component